MITRMFNWLLSILLLDFLPARWRYPVYALYGVTAGVGLVLLRVSEMPSYLSDNPRTCINCHVMRYQYASWQHSSHREIASCNDCHVPHDSLFNKYAFKAKDGLRHSTVFALRNEPQAIRAIAASAAVIQENCLRCHAGQLSHTFLLTGSARRCVDCHDRVPHGETRSLSSTPNALTPSLPPILPEEKR